jgi:hypothetical protein
MLLRGYVQPVTIAAETCAAADIVRDVMHNPGVLSSPARPSLTAATLLTASFPSAVSYTLEPATSAALLGVVSRFIEDRSTAVAMEAIRCLCSVGWGAVLPAMTSVVGRLQVRGTHHYCIVTVTLELLGPWRVCVCVCV